jgi:GNAT superfamily N-acetyltransferase
MAKDLSELGIPQSIVKNPGQGPFKGSTVLTVVCACGVEIELKVSSILRTMRRVGHYRCLSCGMQAKHKDPAYARKQRAGSSDSWSQERRLRQSLISKKMWTDDNFRLRLTEASTSAWAEDGKRQKASKFAIGLWQDSEYVAKHALARSTDEARETRSNAAKAVWRRPEYAEQQLAIKASAEHVGIQRRLALERFDNPEYRQHIAESLRTYWSDPVLRAEMSARVLSWWDDPAYREKQARAAASPDLIAVKSENARAQWQKPETRQAIIDGIKKVWRDPAYRARASQIVKALWQNDEFKKKQAVGRADMLANGKDSILERTAQILLDSLKIPYVRHHVVGYFEFDLLIPSHNVLVECNGEYWHSMRKDRDAAKFTYVDTYFPEYSVLYLWERDFLNPNLIRHKLLRALFGDDGGHHGECADFSFEDLEIKLMDPRAKADKSYYSYAEEFLQSFHYAGFGRSAKAAYGAYLGDTLIGVCKFCPPIRAEVATSMGMAQSQVLELDRFCIHPSYQKKNFASWLVSRCAKLAFSAHPGAACLVSFADSTFGHVGTIYKAANWKQVRIVPPDYHYVSPEGFVVHKKTLYDHASRVGRKEAEYAAQFGYAKAYGKSKTKFRFDRP